MSHYLNGYRNKGINREEMKDFGVEFQFAQLILRISATFPCLLIDVIVSVSWTLLLTIVP